MWIFLYNVKNVLYFPILVLMSEENILQKHFQKMERFTDDYLQIIGFKVTRICLSFWGSSIRETLIRSNFQRAQTLNATNFVGSGYELCWQWVRTFLALGTFFRCICKHGIAAVAFAFCCCFTVTFGDDESRVEITREIMK